MLIPNISFPGDALSAPTLLPPSGPRLHLHLHMHLQNKIIVTLKKKEEINWYDLTTAS